LSKSIADLAASPYLAKLEHLDVRKCGLGAAGLDMLLKAKFARNLTFLDVSQNELNAGAVAKLAKWRGAARLEMLVIGDDHLGDDAAGAFADGSWSGLRNLLLFFNRMGTAGLDALGQCESLAGLRSLNLHHAQDQRLAGLLSSPHLAGLEELRLNARANLSPLATAPMLPNLRALHAQLDDVDSLRPILTAPASAGLRELSFSGTVPARGIASLIAEATHLTNLRKLRISTRDLGADGARDLARAAHLGGLVELDLTWGGVDAACVKELVASPYLNRLRRLVVGGFPGQFGPPYEALEERFGKDVVTRN
jgi:hypothetical protein